VLVAIVVILCALAGYFLLNATHRRDAALHAHDSVLRDLIVEKIQSSPSFKDRNVTVLVNSDVATLSGSVALQGDKDEATNLARSVPGVSDVINNIEVVGAPVSVPKPPETTSPPVTTNQNQPETQPAAQPQPLQTQSNSGNLARANELVRQGNSEINDGKYAAAINHFQEALRLVPNYTAAQNGINRANKADAAERKVLGNTQ
jgi:tetratricopeptide (TPR) repeat protein